jgi:hypothetical protein
MKLILQYLKYEKLDGDFVHKYTCRNLRHVHEDKALEFVTRSWNSKVNHGLDTLGLP